MKQHLILFFAGASFLGILQLAPASAQTPPASSLDLQALIIQLQQQVSTLQKQIKDLTAQLEVQKEEVAAVKTELHFTQALQRGASGDEVKKLQEYLKQFPEIYPEGLVSGFFGPKTEAAVKKLQERVGIESVGAVGPKTIAKLNELVTRGAGRPYGASLALLNEAGESGVIPPGLLRASGIEKKLATTTPLLSPYPSLPHSTTTPIATSTSELIPPPATTTTPVAATTTQTVPALSPTPPPSSTPTATSTATTTVIAPPPPPSTTPSSASSLLDWVKLTNGCEPRADGYYFNRVIGNAPEYGVIWSKLCYNGENEIYFNRFTSTGVKISQDLIISTGHLTADYNYTFAWNGTEYGILWEDYWGNVPLHNNSYDSYSTYFSRVSSQGQKIGTDLKIATGGQYQKMNLFWNGSEYVLIYINYRPNEIRFRKFSPYGQPLGSIKIADSSGTGILNFSVVWTGTEYVISWTDFPMYGGGSRLVRLSTSGDLINQNAPPTANATSTATTTPTQDTAPPVISNIQASTTTATSAVVTWTTDETSDSQVEYGPTTSYGSQTPLDAFMQTTSHSFLLTGLTPSTLYHYRVKSKDAAGNPAVSADQTFTSLALPATPISQNAWWNNNDITKNNNLGETLTFKYPNYNPKTTTFRFYRKTPTDSSFALAAEFTGLDSTSCAYRGVVGEWMLDRISCVDAWTVYRVKTRITDPYYAGSFPASSYSVGEYKYYFTTVDSTGKESLPSATLKLIFFEPITILAPTASQSPLSSPPTFQWTVGSGWPSGLSFPHVITIFDNSSITNNPFWSSNPEITTATPGINSWTYNGPALDPAKKYRLSIYGYGRVYETSPAYIALPAALVDFWVSAATSATTSASIDSDALAGVLASLSRILRQLTQLLQ